MGWRPVLGQVSRQPALDVLRGKTYTPGAILPPAEHGGLN